MPQQARRKCHAPGRLPCHVLASDRAIVCRPRVSQDSIVNANCPTGIEVHADEGGPVYINGKEEKLKIFNQNYYEARLGKVTISLTINPEGSADVSYTRKGGGNGVCKVK